MNKRDEQVLKQCFDRIEIPPELDLCIETALKKGKRKSIFVKTGIAATTIIFASLAILMALPSITTLAFVKDNLPILSKLIETQTSHFQQGNRPEKEHLQEEAKSFGDAPQPKEENEREEKQKEKLLSPQSKNPEPVKPDGAQSAREQALQIAPEKVEPQPGRDVKKRVEREDNKIDVEYVKIQPETLENAYSIDEIKIHLEKNFEGEIGINLEDSLGSKFKSIKQQYDRQTGIVTASFKGYYFYNEYDLYLTAVAWGQEDSAGETAAPGIGLRGKQLFKIKIE